MYSTFPDTGITKGASLVCKLCLVYSHTIYGDYCMCKYVRSALTAENSSKGCRIPILLVVSYTVILFSLFPFAPKMLSKEKSERIQTFGAFIQSEEDISQNDLVGT